MHRVLPLADVIVRTARLLLEVVSLTVLHCLTAAQAWTGRVHVLLRANRVWRRIIRSLRTLTLPVQQIHLRALSETYLG